MTQVQVNERVQLTQDVPDLELRRGEIGLVRGTWFGPAAAYEVEFRHEPRGYGVHALLLSGQIRSAVPATGQTMQ